MDSKLGSRTEVRERRRVFAWKTDAIEPPVVVGALGLLAHELAALKAILLTLDDRVHVPVRYGDGADAHIVVTSRSVLRDGRFNAALRGRRVIVYRREADAPARSDDVVISAPIRVAPLLEALNMSFDRIGAAIRSGPRAAPAVTEANGEHAGHSGTVAHALQRVFAQPHPHDTHLHVIGFGVLSILLHRDRYLADFPVARLREAMRSRRYVLTGNCHEAKRLRDQKLRPLLELRWLAALEGYDVAASTLPGRFRLMRWPDFAQLPHEDGHLTLAALLAGQVLNLDGASRLCGADPEAVGAFLSACHACGYLVAVDANDTGQVATPNRAPATSGLLARLWSALRSP